MAQSNSNGDSEGAGVSREGINLKGPLSIVAGFGLAVLVGGGYVTLRAVDMAASRVDHAIEVARAQSEANVKTLTDKIDAIIAKNTAEHGELSQATWVNGCINAMRGTSKEKFLEGNVTYLNFKRHCNWLP